MSSSSSPTGLVSPSSSDRRECLAFFESASTLPDLDLELDLDRFRALGDESLAGDLDRLLDLERLFEWERDFDRDLDRDFERDLERLLDRDLDRSRRLLLSLERERLRDLERLFDLDRDLLRPPSLSGTMRMWRPCNS